MENQQSEQNQNNFIKSKLGKRKILILCIIIGLIIIVSVIIVLQNQSAHSSRYTQKYNYRGALTNYTENFAESFDDFIPVSFNDYNNVLTGLELDFSSVRADATLYYDGNISSSRFGTFPVTAKIGFYGNNNGFSYFTSATNFGQINNESIFFIGSTTYVCGTFAIYYQVEENLCNGINTTLLSNYIHMYTKELAINITNITPSAYDGINCTYGTAKFSGNNVTGKLSTCMTDSGNALFFKVNYTDIYNSSIGLNIIETNSSGKPEQITLSSLPYPKNIYYNYSDFSYHSALLPYSVQTNYTYNATVPIGNINSSNYYTLYNFCKLGQNFQGEGCSGGGLYNGSLSFTFDLGSGYTLYNVELACATTLTLYGLPKVGNAANGGFGALQLNGKVSQNNASGGASVQSNQFVNVSNLNCYNSNGNEINGSTEYISTFVLMNYTLANETPSSSNNPYYTIEIGDVGAI